MPNYWRAFAPIVLAALASGQDSSSSVPSDIPTPLDASVTGPSSALPDAASILAAAGSTNGDNGIQNLNDLFGTADASYNSADYSKMAAEAAPVVPLPTIGTFQCNTATADVSTGDQIVQCVATASSPNSQVSFISGTFYTPDKTKRLPVIFTQVNLAGGTAQSGTYSTNIVVPMASDEAVWTLGYSDTAFEALSVGDVNGLVHTYSQEEATTTIKPFNPNLKVTSYTGAPLAYPQAQIQTSSGIKIKNLTCWDPTAVGVATPASGSKGPSFGKRGLAANSTGTFASVANGTFANVANGTFDNMAAAAPPLSATLNNPMQITPSMGSRPVTCSVYVKLDAAGLGYVETYFVSPTQRTALPLRFSPTETTEFFTEGEIVYARMNQTINIPYWAESGKYVLATKGGYQGVTVSRAGTMKPITAKDLPTPPTFTIKTASQDIKPPAIQSFLCQPAGAVKVSNAATTKIVCNLKANEDISGINYLAMQFVSPSKDQFMNFAYIPPSQGLGNFVAEPVLTLKAQQSVSLPGGSEPGVWALVRAVAADNAGNYKAYHTSDFKGLDIKSYFVVENSIISFAFDPIDAGAVVIKPDKPKTQSAASTASTVSSLTVLLTTLVMVRLSRRPLQ